MASDTVVKSDGLRSCEAAAHRLDNLRTSGFNKSTSRVCLNRRIACFLLRHFLGSDALRRRVRQHGDFHNEFVA